MTDLTSADEAELQSLIDGMLDAGLDEERAARLDAMLTDPAAADFYARYLEIVGDLAWRFHTNRGALATTDFGPETNGTALLKPSNRSHRRWLYSLATAACLLLAIGIGFWRPGQPLPQNMVGNDAGENEDRVTSDWFLGTRLELVGDMECRWTFDESIVTIDSPQQLPPPLCVELLGREEAVRSIVASWRIEGKTLHLFDLLVDGVARPSEAALELERPGEIRLNLGAQQYSVIKSSLTE